MPSTRLVSLSVPPETPRAFARRADGFRHALAGGLWLAPLVYLEHARFGPGWYGKVVSSDPERLLAWAVSKAIPRRALEVKSLPDVDMPRKGRRRLPGYHIDLWGARLALAYDPETLAAARRRSPTPTLPLKGEGEAASSWWRRMALSPEPVMRRTAPEGRFSTRAPAIAAAEVGSIKRPTVAACRQARSIASSATAA